MCRYPPRIIQVSGKESMHQAGLSSSIGPEDKQALTYIEGMVK
jgi:hypothetical protein